MRACMMLAADRLGCLEWTNGLPVRDVCNIVRVEPRSVACSSGELRAGGSADAPAHLSKRLKPMRYVPVFDSHFPHDTLGVTFFDSEDGKSTVVAYRYKNAKK